MLGSPPVLTSASPRRVNAYGPFFGCKYACAQFLRQDLDANGHRGWIVNVASVAGLTGLKRSGTYARLIPSDHPLENIASGRWNIEESINLLHTAAYCASKAAVVNLTRAVALGYAEHKIHVNALCPGCKDPSITE